MHETDLDPASLRDWMAAVGLLRLASETTTTGRGHWAIIANRYRFVIAGVPETFPICARNGLLPSKAPSNLAAQIM
jgi:hypothetical protein